MPRMKIALVYDVAYPYRLGGGEKRNWEIARRLAARGHEVWLVSMKMWDGDDEFVRDGVNCVGICPWRPELFKSGKRSVSEPWYFARHVARYLSDHDFDIVDCGNFPYLPSIAARRAIKKTRAKLVITWFEARGLGRWLEHRGMAGAGAWVFELVASRLTPFNVAISEFTRKKSERVLGMKSIEVIPCGVDCAELGGTGDAERSDQVLYVGRLAAYKRVDMLIEAFGEIAEAVPGASLKIVGEGQSRVALESMVQKLGLNGRVVFLDSLSDDELHRVYAESKVFVLPSEQEGFGIVAVEAMAAGTPVVVRDAPDSAAADLVSDQHDGLVIGNKDELVIALKNLLGDKALHRQLSETAVRTAAKYDWDSVVIPQLEAYYQRALV